MVKKKTIGKIQLVIGILLLVSMIIGIFYSYNWFNQQINRYTEDIVYGIKEMKNATYFSNDTKYIAAQNIAYRFESGVFDSIEILVILVSVMAIIIVLSMILILQGLVNISEQKLKQKIII